MIFYLEEFVGNSFLEIMAFLIAMFLAVCFAISFHEFSHSYVAYKCGDFSQKLNGRMTLNPFAHFDLFGFISLFIIGFGWAKPVPVDVTKFKNFKRDSALVSLSGVFTNFLLAFFGSFFLSLFTYVGLFDDLTLFIAVFIRDFLEFFVFINLSLGIFNLLPIPPFDGFNFIATFLKYNNKFLRFMNQYSLIIFLLIIIPIPFLWCSILDLIFEFLVNNIFTSFVLFWSLFF